MVTGYASSRVQPGGPACAAYGGPHKLLMPRDPIHSTRRAAAFVAAALDAFREFRFHARRLIRLR